MVSIQQKKKQGYASTNIRRLNNNYISISDLEKQLYNTLDLFFEFLLDSDDFRPLFRIFI